MAKITKMTAPAPARTSTPAPAPVPPVVPAAEPPVVKLGRSPKPATGSGRPKAAPAPAPVVIETEDKAAKLTVLKAAREAKAAEAKAARDARREQVKHLHSLITRVVPCACGCGADVEIRRYIPGHDAKLMSALLNGAELPAAATLPLYYAKTSK